MSGRSYRVHLLKQLHKVGRKGCMDIRQHSFTIMNKVLETQVDIRNVHIGPKQCCNH
ncbi:hypothetical protein GLYMA_16G010600v4 [Glycine max]|uniref:Uncharacterized protein n=2 Tax=Glycine subgen. Soja TaxID=1462606 RepID=K7MEJ4_SOYBN|nr:hypothetical protein GYH30_043781 [Glycine max]KRH06229.1 hypothetical protein GLYMA_16G010600v4 [Glycine max]RZB59002.1 hypothetical protein D0Y65_042353 [Glycine soja]